ncbi:hypothetical protein [Streptomyces tauricus]|uniref:hypothetical protein n=1 Tax=Streptomyces tauricus TaxID=68274 RepID=UPI002243D4C1|nr:hypothetical protein [Streptomyces tauricus]MCW8103006.1 hypothetical protein [Streptomyces tauricus]
MTDQRAIIDAETFPLFVFHGPELLVMQPVARDAVEGLDEAYTEASLDCTGVQSAGTTIDARWEVTPDRRQVLLLLFGRAPARFELTVRYTLRTARERQGFLTIATHADTGRVSLWIYPDKEDTARAAVALQDRDPNLFVHLGICVEDDLQCHPHRLSHPPRVIP